MSWPNLANRLADDLLLEHNAPSNIQVHNPDYTGVWQTACALVAHPGFQSSWITQREYDEVGPSLVHRKCF